MNNYVNVLKKYTVFTGRATRSEYWMFVLVNALVTILLAVVAMLLGLSQGYGGNVLSYVYGLAVFLPSLGVSVRRLHDTNHSGWTILLCLIPVIGSIILLVFLVGDSQPGSNKYGANPKGMNAPIMPNTPSAPTPTASV